MRGAALFFLLLAACGAPAEPPSLEAPVDAGAEDGCASACCSASPSFTSTCALEGAPAKGGGWPSACPSLPSGEGFEQAGCLLSVCPAGEACPGYWCCP